MLSLIARRAESKRIGWELLVNPTVASTAGAPAVARGALVVRTAASLADAVSGARSGANDVVSRRGAVIGSPGGDATMGRESVRADERAGSGVGATVGAGVRGMT
jgi:hypothetical protein